MLTVKWQGLDKLIRDLKRAREKALPYAMRNAVNTAVFEARREWVGEMRRTLTLRNTFTERSVLVDKSRMTGGRATAAVLGSTAPHMRQTEEGGIRRGSRKHLPIATAVAAGQAAGSKRTKVVRAASRLRAIQVQRMTGGKSPKQRNAIALSVARKKRQRFVHLERKGGGTGLFRVTLRGRATMLWDLSRGSVRQPPTPTLERALKRIEPKLPHIYTAALLQELRRWKVLGY
ncbi:MAG: hypothetical protein M3020_24225 [Myxococcota bacterium]|nr:hypothetical protein [Myxococcota bacterium]